MSLLLYYKLDELNPDSKHEDYSNNGYHGVDNGVSFVTGKLKNAGSFDGSTQYITATPSGNIYCASFFVKTSVVTTNLIGTLGQGFQDFIAFGSVSSNIPDETFTWVKENTTGQRLYYYIKDAFTVDTWYLIQIIWNGSTYKIYVDGVEKTTFIYNPDSVTENLATLGSNFTIGKRNGFSSYFSGQIDEFRLYDHTPTSQEITHLNNIANKKYEVIIGGSHYFNALEVEVLQSISDYARLYNMAFKDADRSKRDGISQHDVVLIDIRGTRVFNGLIESKKPTREKKLELNGRDHSLRFQDIYATASFTDQLVSTMVGTLLDDNYPGEFDRRSIEPTIIQRTKNWTAILFKNILQELVNNEDYIHFLDVHKRFIFRAENFVDSGVTFNDTDILIEDFKESSSRVVNSVLIVYGADLDQFVRRRNHASISVYKEKQKRWDRADITSPTEAIEYGDHLLKKFANPFKVHKMTTILSETVDVGEIVTINSTTAGLTNAKFVVLQAKHSLTTMFSEFSVGIITENTIDFLTEAINKLRSVEENQTATTLTGTSVDDASEDLEVTAYLTVEKATDTGSLAGNFQAGPILAGSQISSYSTVINNQKASIVNEGIKSLLRIISEIRPLANPINSNYAHFSLGSSSIATKITDTTLGLEIAREGEYRSAKITDTGQISFQTLIKNNEFLSGNYQEFGLNNSVLNLDGLLVYYPLDTNFKDHSENLIDIDSNSGVQIIDGYRGGSALFEAGDYVDASLTDEMDNLTEWTVMFNVKLNSAMINYINIFDLSQNTLATRTCFVNFSSTGITAEFYDTAQRQVNVNDLRFNDLDWHTVIATFDGTYIRMYLDGPLAGISADLSAYSLPASPSRLRLGETGDFDGQLNKVYFFNRAIDDREALEYYLYSKKARERTPINNNLKAYYPLDSDVLDYSGKQEHGTNSNVTFTTGKIDNAGSFNGTTSKVVFPEIDISNGLHLSVWVKKTTWNSNGWEYVLDNREGNDLDGDFFLVHQVDNQVRFAIYKSSTAIALFIPASNFSDNTWHNIQALAGPSGVYLYLDGRLIDSDPTAINTLHLNYFRAGAKYQDNEEWDGYIDEIRVYDSEDNLDIVDYIYQFDGRDRILYPDLIAKYTHTSALSKSSNEVLRLTWDIKFTGINFETGGLNLIRNLVSGLSYEYIDIFAIIEVTDGSDIHQGEIEAGYPKYTTILKNQIVYQTTVVNPTDYPTGGVFNIVRLYSRLGGTKITEIIIPDVTTVLNENNLIRHILKLIRG